MRYILLGTGGPRLSQRRRGTAHVVLFDDDGLMIDCGPGTTYRLHEAGIAAERIRYLFLTHHHYDHIADYGHFALTRWDHTPQPSPLDVFGPPNTARITDLLFGTDGVYDGDILARTEHPMSQGIFAIRGGKLPRPGPEVRAHDVGQGLVFETARWRMLAGPARHAEPFLVCYSYRLETPERTVVFSGDCGDYPPLAEFARGADTLIHMCTWPDDVLERYGMRDYAGGPGAAGRAAATAGVRKLVLTHAHAPAWDTPEGMAEAVGQAARHFGGEIVFAQDLAEI